MTGSKPYFIDDNAEHGFPISETCITLRTKESGGAFVMVAPESIGVDMYNQNTTGSVSVTLRAEGEGSPPVVMQPKEPTNDGS